mgnify:CR=1 FL=1|jgi:hypothetical protein|tara:strand:- start:9475 stop:10317 length:843 start_codon:yes stop_codon:yes gene_type:complete
MGTINNANVGPAGQVITTAAVDAKFTDVATATATLDVNNVRSEGVDRRTLAASRAEPIVYSDYTDNGAVVKHDYTGQTGQVPFYLFHGGGLQLTFSPAVVLKVGDLLRINYTANLYSHSDSNYKSNFVTTDAADSVGVIFFPTWNIGAGLVVLPSQANVNQTFGAPASIAIDSTNNRTDSIAWCSLEGPEVSAPAACKTHNTVHGTAYILQTGSDVSITQIQINCRGPIAYHAVGGARALDIANWTADPYATPYTFSATQPLTISVMNGQLSAIIMRGDS